MGEEISVQEALANIAMARDDRITSLEAELAEARRERDGYMKAQREAQVLAAQRHDERDAVLAREAVLREALEGLLGRGVAWLEAVLWRDMPDSEPGTITIRLGAIRRARAALSTPTPAQKILDADETEIALRVLRDHDMLEEADKLAAIRARGE